MVFLDIETTGASARNSRITEIGAIRVEDNSVVATFKQLVNPETLVPAFITRMTGISNEMVWKAPTFKAVASQLEDFLSGSIFVAHNVNIDYSFIKAEYQRLGINFNMDRLCTVQLSRKLYPEHRSHALDRVIERMGIEVANRHRAYDDAEVLWKFIQHEQHKDALRLSREIDKLISRQ